MKEQTRNIEVQIDEEEIGRLPEKEFRIMIVKMIKNLENKMEEMQESINKDQEELKNKHTETILSSFHSFDFILFRSYFHHFILQLTDSFFCFRYSAIDSFQSIFNFSNGVVCIFIL